MNPDFLVVGAGVAGLRAAIELARAGEVLVIAKDTLRESSSEYAQGGIAVALADDDEVALHEQDTIAAGDGLCNRAAVHMLVEEGPAAIQQLIDWGAVFDREGSQLAFTREGAHSRKRVLHAHGDSTGHEIALTLHRQASALPSVRYQSYAAVTDLLMEDGAVCGAMVYDEVEHETHAIFARAVLLATGGLGRVYLDTTNPDIATGDGVAMAWRAGAEISDIEFVQFHPTALHVAGAPAFLLSEALRGEGAYLINGNGERFMQRYHRMADLAPRDVVARAIVSEMRSTDAPHVFLDLRHRGEHFIRSRFPRIYDTCQHYGVDLGNEPAPVHPAAHYAMGGVRTDLDGLASLPGLYAAGEAACTGVHGANRLASNSLLEGVVFGARAAATMVKEVKEVCHSPGAHAEPLKDGSATSDVEPFIQAVQQLMWNKVGIVRSRQSLTEAIQQLQKSAEQLPPQTSRRNCEARNIHTAALLIARSALARLESRGAHYRTDYPEHDDPRFKKHSIVGEKGVRFV